jgi:hypothetical protein
MLSTHLRYVTTSNRYRLSNRLSIISKLKILEVQRNLLEALLLTIDHVISTGLCKLRRSTNLKQISATRTSRIPMFDHDRLGIVPVFLNAPRMRLVHTVLLLLPLMKSTTDEKESMTLLSESAKKQPCGVFRCLPSDYLFTSKPCHILMS